MMGHFQQVQAVADRDARREELRVDGLFDVPRQEHATGSEAKVQHRGHVVDAGAGIGWLWRHASAGGPTNGDRRAIEAQDVTSGQAAPIERKPIERLVEGGVPGTRTTHPDVSHRAHAVAHEEEREASHMVLVRVGQHDQIDPPVPGWQVCVKCDEQPVGVRPAIDEHPTPGIALDEDGITLSDVEHGHPQASVRPSRGRERRAEDDHDQGRQPGSPQPPAFARLGRGVNADGERGRRRGPPPSMAVDDETDAGRRQGGRRDGDRWL
jgi:hypothetical protein